MEKCPYCGLENPDDATFCRECGTRFKPEVPALQDANEPLPKYQTFLPRFCASFIDGLIFIPLTMLNGFLASTQLPPIVMVGWSIIFYLSYYFYSVLLHRHFGQTLGKMALRIKVLDVSEQRLPNLKQAVLRDIGYIVLNAISLLYFTILVFGGEPARKAFDARPQLILAYLSFGWLLLEFVTMMMNSKRRALHDLIAGTVVVRMDGPDRTPINREIT